MMNIIHLAYVIQLLVPCSVVRQAIDAHYFSVRSTIHPYSRNRPGPSQRNKKVLKYSMTVFCQLISGLLINEDYYTLV